MDCKNDVEQIKAIMKRVGATAVYFDRRGKKMSIDKAKNIDCTRVLFIPDGFTESDMEKAAVFILNHQSGDSPDDRTSQFFEHGFYMAEDKSNGQWAIETLAIIRSQRLIEQAKFLTKKDISALDAFCSALPNLRLIVDNNLLEEISEAIESLDFSTALARIKVSISDKVS